MISKKRSRLEHYRYLKQLKQEYYENKACIQQIISQVYHDRIGTICRVMMKEYLCNKGYQISLSTVKKSIIDFD